MKPLKRFFWFAVFLIVVCGCFFFLLYESAHHFVELTDKRPAPSRVRKSSGSGTRPVKPESRAVKSGSGHVTREYLSKIRSSHPLNDQRIILIGLDGATFDVLLPLAAGRKLSFFDTIMKNGTQGVLESIRPIKSPAIWTSIATGKSRYKHGIQDFVTTDSQGQRTIPVTRFQRKVKAIWNMMEDLGRNTITLNWWATSPPEPVRGYMVADTFEFAFGDTPDRKSLNLVCHPPGISRVIEGIDRGLSDAVDREYNRILQAIRFNDPGEAADSTVHPGENETGILKDFIESDLLVFRASQRLLKQYPFHLASIYFQGIDVISHHFWGRGYSVEDDTLNNIPGGPVVASYYRFIDGLLGKLEKPYDASFNWMVVSDHGFRATTLEESREYHINRLFYLMDLFFYRDDTSAPDFSRTVISDPRDHDLWNNVRMCYFNINDSGTEQGPVTHENYGKHMDTVLNTFTAMRTGSGKKVFVSITGSGGDAGKRSGSHPDIIFRFNPELRPEDIIRTGKKVIRCDEFIMTGKVFSGSHDIRGIFLASGPGFQKGKRISGGSVLDITPTLLHIFGMPVAEDFDGNILTSCLNRSTIHWNPVSIPTYETRKGMPAKTKQDAPFQKKALEQLKGIGYLK